jgi:hypothetical protein
MRRRDLTGYRLANAIAFINRFASLVLSDEEYNQENSQSACLRANRARRSAAAVRS